MTTQQASSELPPWARYLLLGIFAFAVIPVAVYGVYRQIVTARDVVPAIEEGLLKPYVQVVASGDYDRAHADFTSESFRARVKIEDYRAAQRGNRETYGAPKSLSIHVCNETKEPGRPWFTTCEVRYDGEKSQVPLSLEIVEHEGRYLIDRTFLRNTASDSRAEHVF